jgi:hypothetical protein
MLMAQARGLEVIQDSRESEEMPHWAKPWERGTNRSELIELALFYTTLW